MVFLADVVSNETDLEERKKEMNAITSDKSRFLAHLQPKNKNEDLGNLLDGRENNNFPSYIH